MNSEPRQPIIAAYVQVSGTKGKWNRRTIFGFHNKKTNKLKKKIVGAYQYGND
jgi:hypothetical protein